MASALLIAGQYLPSGQAFDVYLEQQAKMGQPPSGAKLGSAVMGNGSVTVAGLADETRYVAYWVDGSGAHRYVRFATLAQPDPSLASLDVRLDRLEAARDRRPSSIMALGDSITINGWYPNFACASFNAQAYLMWVSLLSKGKLRLLVPAGLNTPVAATSGFTTQQIIDTHLPTILAARPGYCVVVAGANDQPGVDAARTASCIDGLRTMYERLRAAGIVPVCCTVPPRADAAYTYGFTAVNAWIKGYAAEHGLPCADIFETLGDPATSGSYAAALHAGDQIHPNAAGGKAMGQAMWNALAPVVAPVVAPLPASNVRGANDIGDAFGSLANSLFLTDANADGIPDNWALAAGVGTPSLATAASRGNLLTVTRGASDYKLWNAINTDLIAAGDRLLFVAEMLCTVKAGGGKASFQLLDTNSAQVAGIDQWTEDIPAGSVLAIEFSWPADRSSRSRPQISAQAAVGAVAAWGRLGLYNLSKSGALQ